MKGLPLCFLLLIAACTKAPDPAVGMPKPAEQAAPPADSTPEAPQVVIQVAETWKETPPTLSFFLKMWKLPNGGAANLSWLGKNTDIIQMNLDRWLGQWQVESGTPKEAAKIFALKGGAWKTTVATLSGTLMATRSVGGGEPRADWMLVAAVLESPAGPLYFKLMAPRKATEAGMDALLETIKGIRLQ